MFEPHTTETKQLKRKKKTIKTVPENTKFVNWCYMPHTAETN